MRYGYFAHEHRKISVHNVHYEAIGFAEVNAAIRKHEVSIEGLRDWGLGLLRAGRHESGLFSFSYGEITMYDEPGTELANILLAWDGQQELATTL